MLAGAGSGKTRVITHRIAYLLERGVEPEQIVALSFTNKAADEMRSRLAKMVGQKRAEALVLGTFHSLGAWMMREDSARGVRRRGRFTILDPGDSTRLVTLVCRDLDLDAKRFRLGAIVQRVARQEQAP